MLVFLYHFLLFYFFRSIRTCNKKLTRQQTAQPKTLTRTKLREELLVPEILFCITLIPLTKINWETKEKSCGKFLQTPAHPIFEKLSEKLLIFFLSYALISSRYLYMFSFPSYFLFYYFFSLQNLNVFIQSDTYSR